MIVTTFNGTRRAAGMLRSCIQTGAYGLRAVADDVGCVLDIGANVGFFSVAARVLCPEARVVAMEPDPDTYKQLLVNCDHLCIEPFQVALGTGKSVAVWRPPAEHRGCYGARYDEQGDGTTRIPSIRLVDLVLRLGLDPSRLFIKIDCEGGEHLLPGDRDSEALLRECVGVGGEVHPVGGRHMSRRWWKWFERNMSDTHALESFKWHRRGIYEFRAARKARTRYRGQLSNAQPLTVQMLQEVKNRSGRPRRLQQEQLYRLPHARACHMACIGQVALDVL